MAWVPTLFGARPEPPTRSDSDDAPSPDRPPVVKPELESPERPAVGQARGEVLTVEPRPSRPERAAKGPSPVKAEKGPSPVKAEKGPSPVKPERAKADAPRGKGGKGGKGGAAWAPGLDPAVLAGLLAHLPSGPKPKWTEERLIQALLAREQPTGTAKRLLALVLEPDCQNPSGVIAAKVRDMEQGHFSAELPKGPSPVKSDEDPSPAKAEKRSRSAGKPQPRPEAKPQPRPEAKPQPRPEAKAARFPPGPVKVPPLPSLAEAKLLGVLPGPDAKVRAEAAVDAPSPTSPALFAKALRGLGGVAIERGNRRRASPRVYRSGHAPVAPEEARSATSTPKVTPQSTPKGTPLGTPQATPRRKRKGRGRSASNGPRNAAAPAAPRESSRQATGRPATEKPRKAVIEAPEEARAVSAVPPSPSPTETPETPDQRGPRKSYAIEDEYDVFDLIARTECAKVKGKERPRSASSAAEVFSIA